ncbi:hypothetical protein C1646_738180 [Rhizophagus diaphanus]|nr:hypothetical protein C1646_738180 [Rhizophagus diaphanus] [Rhizophagus sp. MUCL 43196]
MSYESNLLRVNIMIVKLACKILAGYRFYMVVKFFIERLDVKRYDLEPKVANFNFERPAKYSKYFVENITTVVHWLAPAKLRQGTKVKFHQNAIFSGYTFRFLGATFRFGMLLWEVAFDIITYRELSIRTLLIMLRPYFTGNVKAQFNLDRMFYAGMVGLKRDKEKGLQYLKMVAGIFCLTNRLHKEIKLKIQFNTDNYIYYNLKRKIIKNGDKKTIDKDKQISIFDLKSKR